MSDSKMDDTAEPKSIYKWRIKQVWHDGHPAYLIEYASLWFWLTGNYITTAMFKYLGLDSSFPYDDIWEGNQCAFCAAILSLEHAKSALKIIKSKEAKVKNYGKTKYVYE
jgi:hypothetical protein